MAQMQAHDSVPHLQENLYWNFQNLDLHSVKQNEIRAIINQEINKEIKLRESLGYNAYGTREGLGLGYSKRGNWVSIGSIQDKIQKSVSNKIQAIIKS
mgnify:CR=1 FL=1